MSIFIELNEIPLVTVSCLFHYGMCLSLLSCSPCVSMSTPSHKAHLDSIIENLQIYFLECLTQCHPGTCAAVAGMPGSAQRGSLFLHQGSSWKALSEHQDLCLEIRYSMVNVK